MVGSGGVRFGASGKRYLTRAQKLAPAVIAGAFVGVALSLVLAPTLFSPLGPVDDHEIVSVHSELAIVPLQAVVIDWAIEPNRFRPLYYVLRVAETALWGTNPLPWHLVRIALAGLTVTLAACLARRIVSWPLAILGGALIVIGPQAEAFYRLGPQEAYATPMILGSLAATLAGRSWLGAALAVAAAFTKEPNVLAAGLLLIPVWQRNRNAAVVGAAGVGLALMGVLLLYRATPDSLQARYLLPWIAVAIAGGLYVFRRLPSALGVAMAAMLLAGTFSAFSAAAFWAARDFAWAAMIADPPTVYVTNQVEFAHAFTVYTGRPAVYR